MSDQHRRAPLSNAEKCKRRRERLKAEDPGRWERERHENKERCKQYRVDVKADPAKLQHQRQLSNDRSKRYQ